uniref:Uncharacterized protein n=1 Tax=Onchocerca volvulus TaxID=6282 RepID=A0A8R1XSK9_ONCVO
MFEKDMKDSSKVLEETKLINKTETVLIDGADAAQYFMYDSIISNGRSASEIANLINDRLISYYKNDDELNAVTADSSQFIMPSITGKITLMSITDEKEGEEKSNIIDIQKTPSEESVESTTIFHHDTGAKKQATKISSTSSTAKSNEAIDDESSSIKDITQTSFDNNDSRINSNQRMELRNEKEDFIIERKNMFIRLPTGNDNDDSDILYDRDHVSTEATSILPFQWIGKNDSFEKVDDKSIKKMHKSMNTSTQLNPPPTDQIDDEIVGIRSSEHSEGKHDMLSGKSRSQENVTNTDSFAVHITVSPKFHTNDTVQESKISEILDKLSNNVSSTMIITSMIDDETTVDAEAVMSWELDKNVSSTTDFPEKKMAKHKQLTNSEQSSIIPELDIDDFAYSLEDLIPTTTSTNLDNLINFRKNLTLLLSKNNGSMKKNDELDSSFAQTNDEEIVETKENETELKANTISESMQRISTSRSDNYSNKKIKTNHRSSHILNLTETESSVTPMDDETSTFEVSEIISKDLSDARSSKTTMNPDILETLQNDIVSTTSNENIGQFALEKSNSFFATDLLAILTKSSPDLSGTLTGTSLSTSDKELLMTTGEPWLIDTSQTTDIFEDSELSTFPATMSSDDTIDVVGLISDTNQRLINDSGSSNMPSATLITSSTIDEIITGDSFTIKSQTLLNHEISDSFDQSTESSNLNLENFIKFAETSMIKPENAIEAVKEIENITTFMDFEAKTTASTGIPMAVFNITIPSSLFDPKFLRAINRTNKDYNYLLMDEVNYPEDNEEDLSKIDFNVDNQATVLDDANETNNDFYSDHDNFLSVTDDTTLEYKFNLANLALTNMHEMNFQPKIEAEPIFNKQTNIVNNRDRNTEDRHRIISSKDNASLLILTKGAIPISPLDKTQISMLSQDFAEFKIKTDDAISDNQESTADKSKTDVTVSQIINATKFDFTAGIRDESSSTQISAIHEVAIARANAENQRKILSLKHISTTPIPEVEEINRNHRKIVHQTFTKDSDSQSETDVTTAGNSTNEESLSITRVNNNNNIANATNNTDKVSQFLSTEVKNSSSRQKSINEFLTWK